MISSISIDKFGDVDSLQLQLKKFHKVDVSSGGASLLTMLLALSQSFLPGHAYDWQNVTRPGESSFGTGRLAVRGKLFDGGTFAKCLHEDSTYCSFGIEFVIENPENPVADASTPRRTERCAAGQDRTNVVDEEQSRSGAAGSEQQKSARPPYADRKRAGADDFREMCRLYGEKFANVKRFALGVESSFAQKNDDNILSYQMVSVRCERVWDEDVTSFFELVLYRNGTNYDLYWDELPDIRGVRTSGHAKGCNVRMRNLAVLDIVSDGVQDGAKFEEVLPSVVRISRIAADQFGTLRFLDVRPHRPAQKSGCHVGAQVSVQKSGCHAGAQVPGQELGCYDGAQVSVQGPCYYVGAHGEYTEAVVRTYTEGRIRVAWPDPETGEIRHGLFEEAYEAWKTELRGSLREGSAVENGGLQRAGCGDVSGSLLRDMSKNKIGSPRLGRIRAEEVALVQGLILRTGETLVLSGDAGLPDKFFDFLSGMGRQIVQIR